MGRYDNTDCPICNKKLGDNLETVVCPECGAPYHKECYLQSGKCIFDELHAKHEDWQPPKVEEKIDGMAQLRCARCGTVNPPEGIFCEVCGHSLNQNQQQAVPGYGNVQNPNGTANHPPMGGFTPPFGQNQYEMPLNPFTTPFGGVAPDEKIEDVPAKELAIFVGNNSHYFLPRFKALAQTKGKAKVINWPAFLFTGWYYLYRKMYGIGILVILINLVLSIPNTINLMQMMNTTTAFNTSAVNMEFLTTINLITSMLSWILRFVCGYLANTFYKNHAMNKIRKIKSKADEDGLSETDYINIIRKKGSVAIKLIMSLVIGYFVLTFFSTYLLLLSGI